MLVDGSSVVGVVSKRVVGVSGVRVVVNVVVVIGDVVNDVLVPVVGGVVVEVLVEVVDVDVVVVDVVVEVVVVEVVVEVLEVVEVIVGRQTGSNFRLLHKSPRHCDTSSLMFIRPKSSVGTVSLHARCTIFVFLIKLSFPFSHRRSSISL